MAIVLVDSNTYEDVEDPTVTVDGTGSDRGILALLCARRGGIPVVTAATLGGNSMTQLGSGNGVDGGVAVGVGVFFLSDADNPGAGSHTLDATWNAGSTDFSYMIFEYTGVDQTTPLTPANNTNSATDQAQNSTISTSLTGQVGEYGFSYIASADGSNANQSHSPDGNMVSLLTIVNTRIGMNAGADIVIAGTPQTMQWTIDDGNASTDSIVTESFVINAAAVGAVGNLLLINRSIANYGGMRQ